MTHAEAPAPRSLVRPLLRWSGRFLALIGALALVYFATGVAADVATFDETSGGYEYPYAGWTGTPIDYSQAYTTSDGLLQPGRIIDLYINCRTGMISYSVLGIFEGKLPRILGPRQSGSSAPGPLPRPGF